VDQAAKVRGMFIHPSQVEEVAADFKEIRMAQAVVERQDNCDSLTFRVLADPSSSLETLGARLQDKIRSVLKVRAEVAFVSEGVFQEPQKRILDLRRWD
jgi:phenylacetate-CoA ligase